MERIRVLLADDDRAITSALGDYLSRQPDMEVVCRTGDGGAVMDCVRETMPDVIVMDLVLPRCDGFEILGRISRLEGPARPQVIILSALARNDLILRAVRLGAAYYMAKPFEMSLICQRIREIAADRAPVVAEISPQNAENAPADEKITSLFLTLGIPANIKGYHYLREAILMGLHDRSLMGRITKELYPGVARRFSTTASKVERAMRHAIDVAWSRGRLDSVNSMYGCRLFEKHDKPTNGEFISCICEQLRMEKSA